MTRQPAEENAVVDVGIPAYRRPAYIVEAIESVLAQTFEAWTLTVSEDGGGSDGVRDAVRPYLDDPRVTYRAMPERVGQSANWTSLIRSGTAPYVALLHDDDRWQPEFLARRVAFLDGHPECGFVFSRTREIDGEGRVIRRSPHSHPKSVLHPEELVPRLIRRNVIGHPPSILVRRSAYEALGTGFRNVLYEDYDMWYRLALRFPVGYLDTDDADYRLHAVSVTQEEQDIRQRHLLLVDGLLALTEAERPGLLSRRERGQPYATIALACALDQLVRGDRAASARFVGAALRRYPPALADRRIPVWALGMAAGSAGSRALRWVRLELLRRRLRRAGYSGDVLPPAAVSGFDAMKR